VTVVDVSVGEHWHDFDGRGLGFDSARLDRQLTPAELDLLVAAHHAAGLPKFVYRVVACEHSATLYAFHANEKGKRHTVAGPGTDIARIEYRVDMTRTAA
jgi:hypothetical protein